ncbi:MAG: caspase family protein [Anaerolineae bacterium]|nr:caspase family protein [Anaerolineae bacterium]
MDAKLKSIIVSLGGGVALLILVALVLGGQPVPQPVLAFSTPQALTDVSPDTGFIGQDIVLTLTGGTFDPGDTFRLVKPGQPDIVATGVTRVSATTLTGTVHLTPSVAGPWHVQVISGTTAITFTNRFTVYHGVYLPTVLKEYPPSEKYAVVVGIADFLYANDLNYTDDDARDFRQALLDYGGFRDENIKMLIDSQATKWAIHDSIINWLDSQEDADSLVVIFYSAHGTQAGGHEYLVAYDSYWLNECIRDDEFGGWLDSLESQQVVVLVDTCHSGGMIASELPKGYQARCGSFRPMGVEETTAAVSGDGFAKDVDKDGRIVMTACTKDELSVELGPPYEHGLFTYYLLEGLTSSSADTSSNGWVSAEEGFSYLYPRVVSVESTQHPQMSDLISDEVDLTQP